MPNFQNNSGDISQVSNKSYDFKGQPLVDEEEYKDEFDEKEEEYILKRIREEALIRVPSHNIHREVKIFDHAPITSKQSEQLRKELLARYLPKIDEVRQSYDKQQLAEKYAKIYEEFVQMTSRNQKLQQKVTESIIEMQQMSDMLLNPPSFEANECQLYSKAQPNLEEQRQFEEIYRQYKNADRDTQDSNIQETIKRAKNFLLSKYD